MKFFSKKSKKATPTDEASPVFLMSPDQQKQFLTLGEENRKTYIQHLRSQTPDNQFENTIHRLQSHKGGRKSKKSRKQKSKSKSRKTRKSNRK